jgi:hypothetical protein
MERDELQAQMKLVIAKAWKQPDYKERLLKNPHAALREVGIEIPENQPLKVKEGDIVSERNDTIIIPPSPSKVKELSEQELSSFAGGNSWSDLCTCPLID